MRTFLLLTTAFTAVAGVAQAQTGPETEVEAVTVLATRTAQRVDEAPATVSVITAQQIEAELATDIKDLVRFEPGVSVVTQPARFGAALGTSGRAGNEGFTIRGLGGDRVLMVVDGVRVPDSFVFGAQAVGRGGYADLDLMKSVEILRGPASALYGSDGVAGAVAFTTKDPTDIIRPGQDFGLRARAGYNSADEGLTYSGAMAGRFGSWSALVGYTTRESQETENAGSVTGFETRPNGTVNYSYRDLPNPQDNTSDAWLGKLVWDFAPNQSLRFTYDRYEADMRADVISGRATQPTPTTPPASATATAVLQLLAADTTERERIGADWRFTDALGLNRGQVSIYRQDSTTRQFTFEDRVGTDRTRDNRFDNEVFGISADATKVLAFGGLEHRVTFGGDWSETTQEGIRGGTVPTPPETFPVRPFPKTEYSLGGLFVQDEISLLNGSLRIIPALRWDTYELNTLPDALYTGGLAEQSDDHISPKLGVVWWANDTFGLFGNWAEGFKAPTPSQVNNGFANLAQGYTSISNPDLKPETSQSFEIGARVRDIDLGGGRVSAQLVGFQAEYDDFITQRVVSGAGTPADPSVYQFVNFTNVEVSGVEAKADAWWENGINARFAFSYAEGENTSAGTTTQLASIDPTKAVFGLGYDDPSGVFGFEAIATWSDAKDRADANGLDCFSTAAGCLLSDDFTLLDLTAYWNINDRVTARAGVFNVLDETYSWWSDVRGVGVRTEPPQPFSPPAPALAYTQPGRNFGLSLSLRL